MTDEITRGIAQIVAALIGATGPLVLELVRGKKAAPTPLDDSASQGEAGRISQPHSTYQSPKTLSDLSLFLLCVGFIAVILSHSLFVSGRTPTLNIIGLLGTLVISLALTGTMYLAWRPERRRDMARMDKRRFIGSPTNLTRRIIFHS